METLFGDPRVQELLGPNLARSLDELFGSIAIAEEMIADRRGTSSPDRDDPRWQAFQLLRPTHPLMQTEWLYRSHVRELLDRVDAGEDTRPGTDAEVMCGISDASHVVPLKGAVVGLQGRLMRRTVPDQFAKLEIDVDRYESLYRSEIDEWEATLRRKARQDWRKL